MTKSRSSRTWALAALVTFAALSILAGCVDSTLDLPTSGDLDLVLTVSPKTVAAGGTVVVSVSAIGTQLLGTVIEFGEGTVDTATAAGAQTQTATRSRVYPTAGVFVVKATVEDLIQGSLTREATVTVN